MKKLLLILLIIVLTLTVNDIFATDYSTWTTRDWAVAYYQSQKEVQRLTQELRDAQFDRLHWMQQYTQVYNMVETHLLPYITGLVNENHRLNQLLDNRYQAGDILFSVNAGVGTSITLGGSFQLFLTNRFYFQVQATGIYARYWNDWDQAPYLSAVAGFGWVWGR